MAKTETLNLEVKSNIKSVTKDTDKMADSLDDVNKEAKAGVGNFTLMGVSLNGVRNSFAKIIPTAKLMFGTIKAGLISTGIGAFVVLMGSLASFFTNTKRGADKLATAFTGVGAAVDVITDRISRVGEILALVFEGKFREAGKLATNIFSGITEEIGKETSAMMALKKRTQELRDADMEFMVQKAATRQEIEKARLNAEDETKSAKERLDALKTALELEEKTTNRELELAKERMEIQIQEMALSENSAEDEKRLAELKTALIETETASVKMRRRVVTEVNALEREIHTEEKARAKEKQDIIDAEQQRIDEEFDAKIKANDEWNKQQIADAKIVADAKIKQEEKVAKAKEDLDKLVAKTKIDTLAMGFASAKELAAEGSALAKAIGVAETIYNTQVGIMQAMKLPPPMNTIQAGITGAMGAVAVAKILSTNPEGISGGGGGGGISGGAAPQTPAPEMMSGAFTLSGGQEVEPARAYVVSDDITNNQNKLAIIRRRATI